MNIEALKDKVPLLVEHMKLECFSKRRIYLLEKMSKEIELLFEKSKVCSYDDYFVRFVQTKYRGTTSPRQYDLRRRLLKILENFVEHGQLPDHGRLLQDMHAFRDLLADNSEYAILLSEMKFSLQKTTLCANSIDNYIAAASSFFLFQQEKGRISLDKLSEEDVLEYFCDPNKHRGPSQESHLRRCLKSIEKDYESVKRVLEYLPKLNNRKKVYKYLSNNDFKKIQEYVLDTSTLISYRDRAIILLAMYTGLRGCDIRELKTDNLDWKNSKICLTQRKTGIEIELPLIPIVGNAIIDYVEKERPKISNNHVFLSNFGKIKPITRSAIFHLMEALYERVSIRQNGEGGGLHIFRHNIATRLLANEAELPVISSILGHIRPESMDPYISADHLHLKECALSISKFPIREEVFQV